jgi:hypothetical protein
MSTGRIGTASAAALVLANVSDVTATATEVNVLAGIAATLTAAELSFVDGVTSSIQTQINTKAPTASPTFTGTVTLPVGLTGVVRADSGVVSVDSDVTDIVAAASDTAAGKVELATTAETTTGTDATRAVTPDGLHDMTSLAGAVWFLDEDAMTSDSATKVPSQQSVKAYVDANVGGGGVTLEQVYDALGGGVLVAGNNIDITHNDALDTITIDVETLTLADISDVTASITEVNYIDGVTSAIQTQLNAKAADADVVHDTGDETIGGVKTFSSDPLIPDEAYGVGWNGSLEPPTKNAVYDKIETVTGGSGITAVVEDETPQLGGNLDLNTFSVGDADAADLTKLSELTATSTELNFVDGVTSAIQTQLGTKAPTASPTFTGTVTLPVGLTGVIRTDTGVVSVDTDVTDLVAAASDTAQGKVELATTAETATGTDATRAVTPDGLHDMTTLAGAAWFLDEDAMTSNSDTKTSSQQAIKAYADTKQPLDSDLTTIAGLTATTDNFMVAASSAWASRTPSQAKTSLALVKGDVGLGNVDNTSDATKLAAVITQSVVVQFGDGTNVLTVNEKRRFSIPVAHTLIRWRILSSISGSVVFDVWRDTFANYPPTVADTISTSKPTLSTATSAEDSSITDWTEVGSAGDVYIVNVDSVTSCVDVVLELWYTRALNV